jgi:hypothetical protein
MREDMSKVVIERPRWGHCLPSSKTRLRIRCYDPDKEYDDLPKRVSGSRSKHIRAREIKYFSDLLGPLRRFLRKNVGRPWDHVYREMKESLDDRKVTGRHVFEHVDMDVETHALIGDDGELYKLGYGGRLLPVYGFYVDPRTGLLCWRDDALPWRPRGPSKGAGQVGARVRLSANTGYFKMKGIWYFIEYKIVGESVDCDQAKQAALLSNMPKVSALPKMIVRKKQLSHKELKAANLRNDHPPAGNGDMSRR